MANRFGKTPEEKAFKPVFHHKRVDQPQKVKKPSVIFVCSTADLFGEWMNEKVVGYVLEACKGAPQHLYLFLTKNPRDYMKYRSWPDRYMLGETCTSGRPWGIAAQHTFLSVEPLLNRVSLVPTREHSHGWDWVIIGARTGPGAVKPRLEWIEGIVNQCQFYRVPLFMKNNLQEVWQGPLIQEYPKAFEGIRGAA